LTFLGLSSPVATPYAPPEFALSLMGPSATITAPNYYTNAPQYFDPQTHTLLFVVGGPNPRPSADYREEYEYSQIFPGPNQPRLSFLESGPPARNAQEMLRPDTTLPTLAEDWPLLSAAYFGERAEDTGPDATEASGASAAGLAAGETALGMTEESEVQEEETKALSGLPAPGAAR